MTKAMRRCKRTKAATCKGVVKGTPTGPWVYWCGVSGSGWHPAPCPHYGKKSLN